MRFSVLLSFLLCSCFTPAVFAQTDTLRTQLGAVEITVPHTFFAVGSHHFQVDSLTLKRYNTNSLSELLQRHTPLYLKNYGTGTATISIRGTKAEHTAVLWNGLNISLPSLGQSDFATLPVSGISSVALQYGPASANYGSASIGGTVLLGSELTFNQGISTELLMETGSFGRAFLSGTAGFSTSGFASRTSVFHSEAKNDFPYNDITAFGKPERRAENAAFNQTGFTQDLEFKLTNRTSVALREWVTKTNRQIQAAMGSNHSNARQNDENIRLMAEVNHLSDLGETTFKTAFFNDVLNYYSDNVTSESEVQTYQVLADHKIIVSRNFTLNTGINSQYFNAAVDGYSKEKNETRTAAFLLLRYDPFSNLHINFNWRQQWFEGFGTTPAPTLAFEYGILKNQRDAIKIKGNISRSYRVPTLNERFWTTGNPNLKPETGWGHEAGTVYNFKSNKISFQAEVTYFGLQVKDWVQWQPLLNGWTPVNLQTVKSYGVETNFKTEFKLSAAEITVRGAYNYTKTSQVKGAAPEVLHKQLIYVPVHTASANSEIRFKNWFLNGNLSLTSERYINYANTQAIDGFAILDIMTGKELNWKNWKATLTGKIYNITNQPYQNMNFSAMPLRHYAISLRINFIKP